MAGKVPLSAEVRDRLLGGKRYSNSLRMSSAPSQSFPPFLISSWQPLLRGESIRPGTAKTCRPYSAAKLAVIRAPLVRLASTTTVPRVIPATIRLRIGKDCLSGGRLNGNCVISAPFAAIRANKSEFSGGVTRFMETTVTLTASNLLENRPKDMPKTAYSYIRFSSLPQKRGESVRRQMDAAKEWC